MSKQVNYNENLCSGAAIRDDKGRRISKLFEASHPKMTVGYAKNLIMPDTPTEQEFNFRQSGGGVIEDGVAVIDKVKGNSVVWNQLRKNYRAGTNFGVVSTQIGNSVTIKGTADSTPEYNQLLISVGVQIKRDGTKYLYLLNKSLGASWGISGYGDKYPADQLYGFFSTNEGTNWSGNVFRQTNEGDVIDIEGLIIQIIDLTQMFGAGNEPSTYEEFLSRKPKVADEYAYNEGTILSNKVEKVKVTGVNLWDEEWENGRYNAITGEVYDGVSGIRAKNPIRVSAGQTYYFKNGTPNFAIIIFLDSKKKAIGNYIENVRNTTFTIPRGCSYVLWYISLDTNAPYNHDICINLSDPTINGKYFPYEKHELDLSWVKDIKDEGGVALFEDGMSGVGSVFDVVTATKAIRRFAMIHLGDLRSWTWYSGYAGFYNTSICDCVKAGNIPCLIAGYNVLKDTSFNSSRGTLEAAMAWGTENAYLKLRNTAFDSTSEDAFIESLQGKYIIYELADPIEVEYDEKNLTYPVVAGGTEEAIASEPSTAFRADVGYGIDAVKTILDLKARVEALEGK